MLVGVVRRECRARRARMRARVRAPRRAAGAGRERTDAGGGGRRGGLPAVYDRLDPSSQGALRGGGAAQLPAGGGGGVGEVLPADVRRAQQAARAARAHRCAAPRPNPKQP
eukprot:4299797-Pyramimonas_sp.AAC.1